MNLICKAITKNAPQAHRPRVAHPCRNTVWHDGYCRVHHPVLRLARLHRKRAAAEKTLQKIAAEIHFVEQSGISATDIPGQLRMFVEAHPSETAPLPFSA